MAIKEASKTIYQLNLHETVLINEGVIEVMRVTSGWLYRDVSSSVTTFVPFSGDFRKSGKGKKIK